MAAIASLTLLTLGAAGCAPLVVGGAAVGATVVAQERGVGSAAEDTALHAEIARRLLQSDRRIYQKVDISVDEGRVLLTGLVPTPQDRIEAARIAWQADGVAEVIDEIEVKDKSTVSNAAQDAAITSQLRSRILFDGDVRSINYTIDTVNGRVFLLGVAQSRAELDRVIDHAREIPYVRGVVPYVRIKDAEDTAKTDGG